MLDGYGDTANDAGRNDTARTPALHPRLTVVGAHPRRIHEARRTVNALIDEDAAVVTEADLRSTDLTEKDDSDAATPLATELEAALTAQRDAREAAAESATRLEEAVAAYDAAARRRQTANDQLRQARKRLSVLRVASYSENEIRQRLEAERQAVSQAEQVRSRARAEVTRAGIAAERKLEATRAKLDALLEERERLTAREGGEKSDSAAAVRSALALYDASITGTVDSEALELAEELRAVESRIEQFAAQTPRPVSDTALALAEADVEQALERRDAIRASLPAANEADHARIEALHAEVEAATEAEATRPGLRPARERLAQARRREREALGELGFTTFGEFMLTAGTGDPGAQLKLWSADRAVRDATEHLDRLRQTREGDPRLAAAREHHQELRAKAHQLLGVDPGSNVQHLLRSHPKCERGAVAALAQALSAAGVTPRGEPLAGAARRWLAARSSIGGPPADLHSRLSQIDATLPAAEDDNVNARARADREVAAARDALRSSSEALRHHVDAVSALERALRERVDAGSPRPASNQTHSELEARIEKLGTALAADMRRRDDDLANARAHHERNARLHAAAHRRAAEVLQRAEPGGEHRDPSTVLRRMRGQETDLSRSSTPIRVAQIVDHLRAGAPNRNSSSTIVLDLPITAEERISAECLTDLAELARDVRIVWLSARPEVIAWASTLPTESGAVLRPANAFPDGDDETKNTKQG